MFRTAWQLAKETWTEFSDDKAFRLAAALAYYTGPGAWRRCCWS